MEHEPSRAFANDRHGRIAKAYFEGMPVLEIRDQFLCAASTVRRAVEKYGLQIRRPTIGRWTPEMKEFVRQKWCETDLTASEIAAEIGMTKEAVVGIIHRGKFTRPESVNIANRTRTRRANGKKAGRKNRGAGRVAKPKTRVVEVANQAPVYTISGRGRVSIGAPSLMLPDRVGLAPGSTPKPWTARGPFECTWPVGGEGADTLSCCARVVYGTSWCRAHNEIGRNGWGGKGYSATPEQYVSQIARCA